MDRYRILIFNDSKWRDMPTSMFTKLRLEKELPGAIVQITTFHLWKEAIENFCPHLVILNNAQGHRNSHIASYVKRHGGVVVVMFTEGLVTDQSFAKVFAAQKNHKHIDAFFCWNDIVADLVDGIVVGCPRFDVYNKRGLIDSKEFFCDRWGLDPTKKIVLLGDSWPAAKFMYMKRNFHRADWKETGAGEWMDAEEFAEGQYRQQEHFKSIINILRFQFGPDIQLVVKAHPMSDYRGWAKWSRETGILVIHSEYSFHALNACDVYVSKIGSITIAEAWLLNKPVLKLSSHNDTASALGQLEADKLNASWDSLDGVSISALIISSLLEANIPEFMELENKSRIEHLEKWGFTHKDSAGLLVKELVSILENTEFSLRYKLNSRLVFEALYEHDSIYTTHTWDGFGNWKKAVVQNDVAAWRRNMANNT